MRIVMKKIELTTLTVPSGYSVKYQWLERLLFKLKWISVDYCDKELYNVVAFDEKDLTKKLLDRYYSIKAYSKYDKPSIVYMGTGDFYDLTSSRELMTSGMLNAFDFTVQAHDGYRLFNLPVKVIPYMEGILFV